jgi:hypothetical protein
MQLAQGAFSSHLTRRCLQRTHPFLDFFVPSCDMAVLAPCSGKGQELLLFPLRLPLEAPGSCNSASRHLAKLCLDATQNSRSLLACRRVCCNTDTRRSVHEHMSAISATVAGFIRLNTGPGSVDGGSPVHWHAGFATATVNSQRSELKIGASQVTGRGSSWASCSRL